MTYHVINEDGTRSGPATVEDLRKWLDENRIGPNTMVENEAGVMVALRLLREFQGAGSAPPVQKPGSPGGYATYEDQPSSQGKAAWVLPVLIGCGVVLVGFFAVAAILFPVFAQSGHSARTSRTKAMTMSNMKQVGLAAIMYSADCDDRLPLQLGSARQVKPVLLPYIRNEQIFTTLNPNGGEFLGNAKINGMSLMEVDKPAETVLFYESNDWPDGRRVVCYADGHVKWVQGFNPARDVKDKLGK
jgi:prepilin-type processing-associated H-X9-DG protein